MSYQKNSWSDGDIITAGKLNNIENGVESVETNVTQATSDISTLQNRVTALEESSEEGSTPADYQELVDDVASLKADLSDISGASVLTGWVDKARIPTNGDTADVTTPTSANAFRYLVANCAEGDVFTITCKSTVDSARPWAFIDANGTILTRAAKKGLTTGDNMIIHAPTSAAKLILNDTLKNTNCYKGVPGKMLAGETARVDGMTGKSITLNKGTYYYSAGVIIGTSLESGVAFSDKEVSQSVTFTLPAHKVLRIVGTMSTNVTASTRVWRAYNASTGKLVAISPQTSDKTVDYLCFDYDTHIYFNTLIAEDYYIGILEKESPYYDIYTNTLEVHDSIIDLNKEAIYAINTMRRPERSQTRPFIICHFSDIHADADNMARIAEFLAQASSLIDAKICTGDMVANSLDDSGMDWWDAVSGTSDIMLAVGNHECATGTGGSVVYNNATPSQVYNAVFADRISAWGVTQPADAASNGLGYYYKDYATYKLRLIVLDINHDSTYKSDQLTWLSGVLADAKTNTYAVVIADHYQFAANSGATKLDTTFNPGHAIKAETNNWVIPDDYVQAVDDFIDGGGEFVCWLAGHGHQDYTLINSSNKQMSIAVTTANFATNNAWSFGDDYREAGTRSQDAFNIVAIDTYSKNVSVYRIGNDLSRLMQPRHRMCLDYANRKVVWSD